MLLHGDNGAGVPVVQSGQMAGSGCFVPTCWAGTNRKGLVALTGMRLRPVKSFDPVTETGVVGSNEKVTETHKPSSMV